MPILESKLLGQGTSSSFKALTAGAAGGINVNAGISTSAVNGNIALDAGTAALITGAGGTLALGSGNITLTADSVTLGANITGTGILTLQPTSVSRTIGFLWITNMI